MIISRNLRAPTFQYTRLLQCFHINQDFTKQPVRLFLAPQLEMSANSIPHPNILPRNYGWCWSQQRGGRGFIALADRNPQEQMRLEQVKLLIRNPLRIKDVQMLRVQGQSYRTGDRLP